MYFPSIKIELIQGDITTLSVDAIVNAANNSLLGGGGVDGAIHRIAGPYLLTECEKLNGCDTGEAKITKGYQLPAKFVIHTVGPVWKNGLFNEEKLLESCYSNSMKLALEYKIKTIAFPAISTGVYEFPKQKAASIAINTVKKFIDIHLKIEKVTFVVFDSETYNIYSSLLNEFSN